MMECKFKSLLYIDRRCFLIHNFSFFSDLSRNKLTELPQECTDYFSLERLVLYHNTIRSIPDSIVYLQSLQFLDLSRNQLSYLPISICELPLQVCKKCDYIFQVKNSQITSNQGKKSKV